MNQSCDKNPYTHRTIQKATWQHKNATKNFDYTTIADRLRTVIWSNSFSTVAVDDILDSLDTIENKHKNVGPTYFLLCDHRWAQYQVLWLDPCFLSS